MITEGLMEEYVAIAYSLKTLNIPFRIIISHREDIDERLAITILKAFNVRGLSLSDSISSSCFPRDLFVDYDDDIYINPDANLYFPDGSGIISPLGVGGRVLELEKKLFIANPRGYTKAKERDYEGINRLSRRFQIALLPFHLMVEIDKRLNTKTVFPSDHLDRVAAFIRGKDGRDYLLLDSYYAETVLPYETYWTEIKEACYKLDVTPIIIKQDIRSIPYSLNLEQFANGKILLTGGDDNLTKLLGQIVGDENVNVTEIPIINYPLYRFGGIRCMLLHAPKKIIGGPVIEPDHSN